MIVGYFNDIKKVDKKLNQKCCTYSITEGGFYLGDYIICLHRSPYQGKIMHAVNTPITKESIDLLKERLDDLEIEYVIECQF